MKIAITGMGAATAAGYGVAPLVDTLRSGRSQMVAGAPLEPPVLARLPDSKPGSPPGAVEVPAGVTRLLARSGPELQALVWAGMEAWVDASLHGGAVPPRRIGLVIAGHNLTQSRALEVELTYAGRRRYVSPRFVQESLDSTALGIVSEALGIRGEGVLVGAASASGNAALIHGCRMIADSSVDACLVLGAPTRLTAMQVQSLANTGALGGATQASNPRRACRPFDEGRDGFIPGQAAAAMVLESIPSAAGRGRPMHATVLGYGSALAARSGLEPSVEAEAEAMTTALARAGLSPGRVDYVNAHGTASRLGDETEAEALRRVFGAARPWINSTKGWVGHAIHAAGVLEAVAVVAQLCGGFVHPNANLDRPIDSALHLVGPEAIDQPITHALSNGFGFGGINTSIAFGRAPRAEQR
ncbi:MAG: beta-ketoacyl synthase N-terminal-like domain-containing protein [Myxococcota bacterium]